MVSNFYLKRFANQASQVRQIDRLTTAENVVNTSDATVIKDFYTVALPDGSPSDVVEQAFAGLEGPAAAGLESAISDEWPLVGERRAVLASWIALQFLRGSGVRSHQTQMRAQLIALTIGVSGKPALRQIIERSEGSPISDADLDAEWLDLTKLGGPDLQDDPVMHVSTILEEWPKLTRLLIASRWTRIRFDRRRMLTSDHPVSLMPDPRNPAWMGLGIVTAAGVLLPLSRALALSISYDFDGLPEVEIAGTTVIANQINWATAVNGRRFIYHHPDDVPMSMDTLPEPSGREIEFGSRDLYREEGLFGDLTPDQLAAFPKAGLASDDREGFTIEDIPWPIPGRRSNVQRNGVEGNPDPS